MPLSDHEQRILDEIEAQLYASDPGLAQQVASTTLFSHARRNIGWSLVGFFVGFAILGLTFQSSIAAALVGFLVMFAAVAGVVRNARVLGRASSENRAAVQRGAGIRSRFGDASRRVRDRFKRDDSV